MIDCACGKIHESNFKILVDIDEETGQKFEAWALCEEHARHQPCRTCLARDFQESGHFKYNKG